MLMSIHLQLELMREMSTSMTQRFISNDAICMNNKLLMYSDNKFIGSHRTLQAHVDTIPNNYYYTLLVVMIMICNRLLWQTVLVDFRFATSAD